MPNRDTSTIRAKVVDIGNIRKLEVLEGGTIEAEESLTLKSESDIPSIHILPGATLICNNRRVTFNNELFVTSVSMHKAPDGSTILKTSVGETCEQFLISAGTEQKIQTNHPLPQHESAKEYTPYNAVTLSSPCMTITIAGEEDRKEIKVFEHTIISITVDSEREKPVIELFSHGVIRNTKTDCTTNFLYEMGAENNMCPFTLKGCVIELNVIHVAHLSGKELHTCSKRAIDLTEVKESLVLLELMKPSTNAIISGFGISCMTQGKDLGVSLVKVNDATPTAHAGAANAITDIVVELDKVCGGKFLEVLGRDASSVDDTP